MSAVPQFAVLCVDDDEDSRVMLGALLSFFDVEVKAVGNAIQALGLIESECFDLYLLDAWLPDVDGFELCRRLRQAEPFKPILFFSGAASETDKEKGIQAGATGYVVKPDIGGLLESITQFLLPTQRTRVDENSSLSHYLPALRSKTAIG
jgi:two-component system sensor histidine kinase/response regulator